MGKTYQKKKKKERKEAAFPLIFSITLLKSNGLGAAPLSSLSQWRLLVHETSLITFIFISAIHTRRLSLRLHET